MKLDLMNVSKKFEEHHALENITLNLPECNSLVLLGPSGSGKSTLLRMIAGLIVPDSGDIFLDNTRIDYAEKSLRNYRKSVGTVFQALNLFTNMTALENILLPLHRVHGMPLKDAKEVAMDLLTRFHLQDHANKMPSQLSGGQSQRVAIVRAVAIKPRMILLDEPTSALDPLMTSEVLDLIVELKHQGSNFILSSHHITFVKTIAEWVVFLSEGILKEAAPCQAFFQNPQSTAAKDFLRCVLKY